MAREVNVLVVDDEQIVLDSIIKLLKRDNYAVYTALSVDEALKKMKEVEIDIILTDLMMPDIDGLELMAMVKKERPILPVIMITGYATINTALQATQLGAFDYIAKPFSKKELLGVLKRASDLVLAGGTADVAGSETADRQKVDRIKAIGDNSWMMLLEDGTVMLGIEGTFIQMIGRIQTIYLPAKGDEIRQGGQYLQIFSADMRSHTILSPLTGTVTDVNRKVLDDPSSALQDPYGEGWLIKLKPSRFDAEIKLLGL
ncbi:MAG TPA: response regulator [candidate division Zixibacteria bacterium]|nr:response regulator [candidate division Zixibacteria bacterium]